MLHDAPWLKRACLWSVGSVLGGLLTASNALALQPLDEFMAGARRANTDEQEALLAVSQEEGESLAALGRTLPSASARGVYTRNGFEAELNPSQLGVSLPESVSSAVLIIQPYNQLDAYLELDVPIVDVAGWMRTHAAEASLRAARKNASATVLDIEKQVAKNYYQIVGAEALEASAERTLQAAVQNLALTRERLAGGVATDLDVYRAEAEVERARQSISDAQLTAELLPPRLANADGNFTGSRL